jgi:hypothetical protein
MVIFKDRHFRSQSMIDFDFQDDVYLNGIK